jgi:hypothetical protein
MNLTDQTVTTSSENTGSSNFGRVWPWLAAGALAALGVANGFLFNRINDLQTQVAQERSASATEISALKEAQAAAALATQQNIVQLSSSVEAGTRTASVAAQRAAQVAERNAQKMVHQLAEEQKASSAAISKAIGEVKTVTEAHSAQVTGLESSVGSVKAEVAETKTTLDNALSDLHSVRGDLGVQSGLIATNSKELQALRELGDRQYFEFTLRKGAGPAKMANMTVELKKADTKRNKYNINIVADDKRVEKKDRTINEPVQMYVGGMRQPYEIVVNAVTKDAITGYLAVPKVLQSRR